MSSPEEIARQQHLLATYRETLAIYLEQQAKLGTAYAPPSVVHGIRETREHIKRIKETLRGWGVGVEDYPDDEEPVLEHAHPQPRSLTEKQRTLIGKWKLVRSTGNVPSGIVKITDITMLFSEDGIYESFTRVRLMFLTVPQHYSGVYSFTSDSSVRIETTQNENKEVATYEFAISNDMLQLISPVGYTFVLKREL